MAGYQLNMSTDGSTDWSEWANAVEKSWKGYLDITVNNWDTTGVPAIAEGGCMELGGSIFYFGDTEAITGTPSTANLNYIMVTASSSNATVSYTTTAPSWIANKGGWYDATEAKRYIGGCSARLGMKWKYDKGQDNRMEKTVELGDWNMNTVNSTTILHGLHMANLRNAEVWIRDDTAVQTEDLTIAVGGSSANMGGYMQLTATKIYIFRFIGGRYDSTGWQATSFNRGWATVQYVV